MSGRLAVVRDERADRDPELAGDLLTVLDVLGGTGIPLACIPLKAMSDHKVAISDCICPLSRAAKQRTRGSDLLFRGSSQGEVWSDEQACVPLRAG